MAWRRFRRRARSVAPCYNRTMLGLHRHGHGLRFQHGHLTVHLFRRGTSSGREWIFDAARYALWHVRFVFWKAG